MAEPNYEFADQMQLEQGIEAARIAAARAKTWVGKGRNLVAEEAAKRRAVQEAEFNEMRCYIKYIGRIGFVRLDQGEDWMEAVVVRIDDDHFEAMIVETYYDHSRQFADQLFASEESAIGWVKKQFEEFTRL